MANKRKRKKRGPGNVDPETMKLAQAAIKDVTDKLQDTIDGTTAQVAEEVAAETARESARGFRAVISEAIDNSVKPLFKRTKVFARKARQFAVGEKEATKEQDVIRKEIQRIVSQKNNTLKILQDNIALLTEKAKTDPKIANLLKKVGDTSIASMDSLLTEGREVFPEQAQDIVTSLEDITNELEESSLSLKVSVAGVVENTKKILEDKTTTLEEKRETIGNLKAFIRGSELDKEVQRGILGMAHEQFNATEEENQNLTTILEKLSSDSADSQVAGNYKELKGVMGDQLISLEKLRKLSVSQLENGESLLDKFKKDGLGAIQGTAKKGLLGAGLGVLGLGGLETVIEDLWDLKDLANGGMKKAGGLLGKARGLPGKAGGFLSKAKGFGGKGIGLLGKGAGYLGKMGGPLAGLLSFGGNLAAGDSMGEAGSKAGGSTAGGALGAALGTMLLPGVGTLIGGVLGGVAGDWLGGKLYDFIDKGYGKKMMEKIKDGATQFGEFLFGKEDGIFAKVQHLLSKLIEFSPVGLATKGANWLSNKITGSTSSASQKVASVLPNRLNKLLGLSEEEKTREFLKQEEGVRTSSYKDSVGLPTTGVGHLIKSGEEHLINKKLTKEEADGLLDKDTVAHQGWMKDLKVPINSNMKSALTSLAFNLGPESSGVKNVIGYLNAGKLQEAADEFLKYDKAGAKGEKKVLAALSQRRGRERALFLTPDESAMPALSTGSSFNEDTSSSLEAMAVGQDFRSSPSQQVSMMDDRASTLSNQRSALEKQSMSKPNSSGATILPMQAPSMVSSRGGSRVTQIDDMGLAIMNTTMID